MGEDGGERALELWPTDAISAVNWSEVCLRLPATATRGATRDAARERILAVGTVIEPFGAQDAEVTADLRPATGSRGLSLGDRACLALARRLAAPAVTADRAWAGLDLGIEVQLIR